MDADSIQQMLALKEMICGDEEDTHEELVHNPNAGSVLKPSSINGGLDKKELAKPYQKIDVKVGEKPDPNAPHQVQQQQSKKENQEKKQENKNDIWAEDEVKDLPVIKGDNRQRPEFEVLFKQKVGANDVFLGMSGMDPTSTKCQELLIKVMLPETKLSEISCDVTKEAMVIQAPKYYLHHIFPYEVKDKDGQCKWVSDKETLQITLPIVRDDTFDF